MIRATDIHSLTEFTRNAKSFIHQITTSKNPVALTVNGEAQVVVQDAESFQRMVDELERSRFLTAMRKSEAAVRRGEVQDLDLAFEEIRKSVEL